MLCVRFDFNAAPSDHNHRLASGLIFRGTSNFIQIDTDDHNLLIFNDLLTRKDLIALGYDLRLDIPSVA